MKSRAYKTLLAVYEHYAQTENLFAIELSPSHRFHLGLRMLAKLRKINMKLITLRRFRSNADTIPQIIHLFIHFDTNRNSQTSFLTKRVTTIIYYSESVFDLSIWFGRNVKMFDCFRRLNFRATQNYLNHQE